ncbi:hypothetical protein DFH09DRAFT_1190757 [Mycena vulgaris]|nr:hypothetical protein DFH09DRAFT_1190757 [Mycena vulgaris]
MPRHIHDSSPLVDRPTPPTRGQLQASSPQRADPGTTTQHTMRGIKADSPHLIREFRLPRNSDFPPRPSFMTRTAKKGKATATVCRFCRRRRRRCTIPPEGGGCIACSLKQAECSKADVIPSRTVACTDPSPEHIQTADIPTEEGGWSRCPWNGAECSTVDVGRAVASHCRSGRIRPKCGRALSIASFDLHTIPATRLDPCSSGGL